MAVIAVSEVHDGRDFDSDISHRRYTRVFLAKTNARHDEGFVVQASQAAFGVSVVGGVHHRDPFARCKSVRGDNSAGPFIWTINCQYSTHPTVSKKRKNPLDDPVEVSWADLFKQELTQFEIFKQIMTNSAGDPYDTPVPIDVGVKVATLKFNLDGENPLPPWFFDLTSSKGAANLRRKKFNDADIIIDGWEQAAMTVMCDQLNAGPVQERNQIKFRECTAKLITGQRDYIERVDEGFRQKRADGTLEMIRNADGSLPSKPVPLDGSGQAVPQPRAAKIATGAENRDTELEDGNTTGGGALHFRKFFMHALDDFTVIPGVTAPP